MSELQAVFWDMDGTLVDTEPYWIEAEHELLAAHGAAWSDDQAHQLVGQALSYSAAVLQQAGVAMDIDEIVDHLTTEVMAKCAQIMPWRPGARELLDALNNSGVRCALVTMSMKPLADAVVKTLPDGQLEFMVTGDMVVNGKPDPESYDLAFETMAVDHQQRYGEPLLRSRCIAIEDSVPGTAAAAASGVVTVAVPHYAVLEESPDWHVVNSLEGVDVAGLEQLLTKTPAAP